MYGRMNNIHFAAILLSALFILGLFGCAPKEKVQSKTYTYDSGGIIRYDKGEKFISLAFTADEHNDGKDTIPAILDKQNVKGNFFFTGKFYRAEENKEVIERLVKEGHYLGGHSDMHLLYCDWGKRDSTLVTQEQFTKDIEANYAEMKKFGIEKRKAPFFMPPYEWYNKEVAGWAEDFGVKIVNFSPGTYSNADYTVPEMGKGYRSTEFIYNKILEYEEKDENGLNGFVLLLHFGTDERREDKFYYRLEELITELKNRGYGFKRLDEVIEN